MSKPSLTFSSAQMIFFTHATENPLRVLEAVTNVLQVSKDNLEESNLEGHFGNPIKAFKAHLIGPQANDFVKKLFTNLSAGDKRILSNELDRNLDEHQALHIRVSKQLLFEGKIGLSQSDAIKIKLKPKFKAKPHEILEEYRRLLE